MKFNKSDLTVQIPTEVDTVTVSLSRAVALASRCPELVKDLFRAIQEEERAIEGSELDTMAISVYYSATQLGFPQKLAAIKAVRQYAKNRNDANLSTLSGAKTFVENLMVRRNLK